LPGHVAVLDEEGHDRVEAFSAPKAVQGRAVDEISEQIGLLIT